MSRLISVFLLLACLSACAAPGANPEPGTAAPEAVAERDLAPLQVLAEQGDAEAQYQVAAALLEDTAQGADTAEAIVWLRRAADAFHPAALNKLGEVHEWGLGVEPSADEAIAWYRKAAALADRDAWANMGRAYEVGLGVEPDDAEALRWYRRAAEKDHSGALTAVRVGGSSVIVSEGRFTLPG